MSRSNDSTPRKKPKRDHDRSAKGGIPHTDPFIEMLQSMKVSDVLPKNRKVIVLNNTENVNAALQCLGNHKILSAPVIDKKTENFIGFLDVIDLVSLLINIFFEGKDYYPADLDPETLKKKNEKFLNKPIKDILDISNENPTCHVMYSTSLFQCIGLFQKGVHRVAVIDTTGKTKDILTQSDILRFLISKIESYPTFFEKTATELNLGGPKKVISVHKDEISIVALRKLAKGKVSALAVVDDLGQIVGNLSASELKGKGTTDYGDGADPFGTLQMPVLKFLEYSGMTIFPVGTCSLDTTFTFLLLKLTALRVHRLWVVDKQNRPHSVITLTDIMQALIAQKQPERKE